MRIEKVTDIAEIIKCLPMERQIKKERRGSIKESHLLYFIQSQLNNPLFGFWIGYDDENEIKGYLAGMANPMPGMERFLIFRINIKDKTFQKPFEETIKQWCKQFNLKIAMVTISDGKMIKVLQKKYGWKSISVNMERRYV